MYRKYIPRISLTRYVRCHFLSPSNNTFDSIDSATRARDNLSGCDIYSGCCTLKIDFAKVSALYLIYQYIYFFKTRQNTIHCPQLLNCLEELLTFDSGVLNRFRNYISPTGLINQANHWANSEPHKGSGDFSSANCLEVAGTCFPHFPALEGGSHYHSSVPARPSDQPLIHLSHSLWESMLFNFHISTTRSGAVLLPSQPLTVRVKRMSGTG